MHTHTVSYESGPVQSWLSAADGNCAELNCRIDGPESSKPWITSYYINGVEWTSARFPSITPQESGSLLICNVDLNIHTGTYRCEVADSNGYSAYRQLSLSRDQLDRFVHTLDHNQDNNVNEQVLSGGTFAESRSWRMGNLNCTELVCTAIGGVGPISYGYILPMDNTDDFEIFNNRVRHCSTCPMPTGTYECEIADLEGSTFTALYSKASDLVVWNARLRRAELDLSRENRENQGLRSQLQALEEQVSSAQQILDTKQNLEDDIAKAEADSRVSLADLTACESTLAGVRRLVAPCE
ncbi:uncharacterized protein LOC135829524 [Sycon ciliatum]|uniref:uncharacterized protein LOC135829524 n=1 Tax=Sycon ciliatum TaxID=27933 RepID=UPI0031F6B219